MRGHGNTWALVLAAGEGNRLRNLTMTATGLAVPKQFCSLRGGPSLLNEALLRAWSIVPPERTCTIVAAQHRRWWHTVMDSLPAANVIVQPGNRGTAIGLLLSLLHITRFDPLATIVVLPSDHHVRDEKRLRAALQNACAEARSLPAAIVILGIEPAEADPELGYIVPRLRRGYDSLEVQRFVEKPVPADARELIKQGAVWNSFIIVASASALFAIHENRCREVVFAMRLAFSRDQESAGREHAMERLYETLPALDFSRDILPGQESRLRVLRVPQCGWSDLGTPKRVADVLRRLPQEMPAAALRHAGGACLDLATQHAVLPCLQAPQILATAVS